MAYASIVWDETPQDLGANVEWLDKLTDKQLQSIEFQIDEMWSFVDFKKNKKWIWVVYCPATKQVLAMHFEMVLKYRTENFCNFQSNETRKEYEE